MSIKELSAMSSKDNNGEDSDIQMDEGTSADRTEAQGDDEAKEKIEGNDKKRQRIDGIDDSHTNPEQGETRLNSTSNINSGRSGNENDANNNDLDRRGGNGDGELENVDTTDTKRNDSGIDYNIDKMEDSDTNGDDHDRDDDDSKRNKNDKDYVEKEDSNTEEDDKEDEEDEDEDEESTETEEDEEDDKPRQPSLRTTRKRHCTLSTPTPSKKNRNTNRAGDDNDNDLKNGDGDIRNDDDGNNDNDDNESEAKGPKLQPIVDLDAGTVTFSTPAVHQQLICKLCNGLFRDPFTISECLHTFCKTCIFFAFQDIGLTSCPRCKVSLNPDPFKFIMFDRTMQELVDKLFPELKEQDMEEEKVFFESLDKGEDVAYASANAVVERFEKSRRGEINGNHSNSTDAGANAGVADSSEVEPSPSSKRVVQNKHNLRNNDNSSSNSNTRSQQIVKKYKPPPDEMNLSLYPLKGGKRNSQLPPLDKPLLQTSGRLRIIHLKKYIIQQLALKSIPPQAIEVRCNGDHVGDELSLTFIKKTRWLDVTKDLTLHYRLDGKSIIA